MNKQLEDLLRKTEGRYLTDQEEERMLGYAQGLLERLDTLQAIERAETAILDDVVEACMRQFPVMAAQHGAGTQNRVRRDQLLVLRYAALAMLQLDPDFIHDKLSVWLRTILTALCDLEQVVFGYDCLIDACRKHLSEDDASALVPYLEVHRGEFERGRNKAA